MIAVLLHDPGFERCSESETARALIEQLTALHGHPEVRVNVLPGTEPYVLWDVFPRHRRRGVLEEVGPEHSGCVAAIAVDVDDGAVGYDFYLVTTDNTEPAHDVVESGLRAWGGAWPTEQRHPWAPYRHLVFGPSLVAVPRDEPPYVVWNSEHHGVGGVQAAYAERVLPVLKELGIKRIIVTRSERSGRFETLDKDPAFDVRYQDADLLEREFRVLIAEAFCLVVSVPSTQMLTIPRALWCGVPVYAYRVSRWREQFVSLDELRAYRFDPELRRFRRGVHRRLADIDIIDTEQVEFAEEMARYLRLLRGVKHA